MTPLTGWRLLDRVGDWHGEAWRARRESDGLVAIHEYITLDGAGSSRMMDTIARVRGVEHPNLLGVLQAELTPSGVVVTVPSWDGAHSLRDLEERHRRRGEPRLQRGELLDYMRTAADGG